MFPVAVLELSASSQLKTHAESSSSMRYFGRHVERNPPFAIQFVEECVLMGKVDYAKKFMALMREKEPDIKLRDGVAIMNYSNYARSRTADENVKLLVNMERLGLIFHEEHKFAVVLAMYV